MKINKLVVGELQENCYILTNEKNEALVIDPGDESEKILAFLRPYHVVGVLVTHHHFDHVGALNALLKYYDLKENEVNGNFSFRKIKTPGHTMDSYSYYFEKDNVVFVGDFIFAGTIGRTDLGGNNTEMKKSLESFITIFPLDVTIYPGHGKSTILKKEMSTLKEILKSI